MDGMMVAWMPEYALRKWDRHYHELVVDWENEADTGIQRKSDDTISFNRAIRSFGCNVNRLMTEVNVGAKSAGGEGPGFKASVVVTGQVHCALMMTLAAKHNALVQSRFYVNCFKRIPNHWFSYIKMSFEPPCLRYCLPGRNL